jgi:hypothetical protein
MLSTHFLYHIFRSNLRVYISPNILFIDEYTVSTNNPSLSIAYNTILPSLKILFFWAIIDRFLMKLLSFSLIFAFFRNLIQNMIPLSVDKYLKILSHKHHNPQIICLSLLSHYQILQIINYFCC